LGVKRAIRVAKLDAANVLAERALAMRSVAEIRALLSSPPSTTPTGDAAPRSTPGSLNALTRGI